MYDLLHLEFGPGNTRERCTVSPSSILFKSLPFGLASWKTLMNQHPRPPLINTLNPGPVLQKKPCRAKLFKHTHTYTHLQ